MTTRIRSFFAAIFAALLGNTVSRQAPGEQELTAAESAYYGAPFEPGQPYYDDQKAQYEAYAVQINSPEHQAALAADYGSSTPIPATYEAYLAEQGALVASL